MASVPITSQQIDGEKVEAVTGFIFSGSRITVDDDCSHEIKRCLLYGRRAMTNLGSVIKSRDITLATKVYLVKGVVFPLINGCESWTTKKVETARINAFKLWCWRKLLRVPWTSRRSDQSILMTIHQKPQYIGLLMWRDSSFKNTLMVGKIEGKRGGDGRAGDG